METWRYGEEELKVLTALEDRLKGKFNVAAPFVPYAGPAFRQSRARVMFLGKATEGPWRTEEKDGYEFDVHAERFVGDSVATGEYGSAFWRFMVELVCRVQESTGASLPAEAERRRWALERVAWTNMFKLGLATRGAPSGEFAQAQWDEAKRLLTLELQRWEPSAVVAVVGNSYGDYMYEFFGKDGWEQEPVPGMGNEIWARSGPGERCRVYWSRHPQGATTEQLEKIAAYVAADQGRLLGAEDARR